MAPSLPSFKKPPLVEMYLGIQFDPLPALRAAHIGEYLASLASEWEILPETPALGQTREPRTDSVEWGPPGASLAVSSEPSLRQRAFTKAQDRMLQIENGWFILNWSRVEGGPPYPRFGAVLDEFRARMREFTRRLSATGVGALKPNLWEVGYVNMIPQEPLWRTVADWHRVVPLLFGKTEPLTAGVPRSASGRWVVPLAESKGRLQIFTDHVRVGGVAEKEALMMKLVARGPTQAPSLDDATRCFDLGHETIVTTFREIVSIEACKVWELT